MADFSFTFYDSKPFADLKIENGDFVLADTLESSSLISLFSDRRANDDELARYAGATEASNRAWWANTFKQSALGSKLWLLSREKKTQGTLSKAQKYCNESLQYLISGGVAKSVNTTTSFVGSILRIIVSITKQNDETIIQRYDYVWREIQ